MISGSRFSWVDVIASIALVGMAACRSHSSVKAEAAKGESAKVRCRLTHCGLGLTRSQVAAGQIAPRIQVR